MEKNYLHEGQVNLHEITKDQYQLLIRYAKKICKNSLLAQDIVQDVLLGILENDRLESYVDAVYLFNAIQYRSAQTLRNQYRDKKLAERLYIIYQILYAQNLGLINENLANDLIDAHKKYLEFRRFVHKICKFLNISLGISIALQNYFLDPTKDKRQQIIDELRAEWDQEKLRKYQLIFVILLIEGKPENAMKVISQEFDLDYFTEISTFYTTISQNRQKISKFRLKT
ncbi:MAG: hypothetical protein UR28_C0003G0048 [Candidatus Peregrinibacteria bacterium GW2011_GWF2_33_10]|nr:MAG: hypothetical protein UR28_C0003G0048 [Candidatus Peregrinibacteria bacterium GW2011_GWF2_33_10]OGJ44199.1 MAG: hypothetical protein A2263_04460 [Candidatus Peregrinibacteria bacterium RIFOXYA2_FULL_33_21]OGJ46683.1 MAG: hypothetical protein A2272_04720 [Candidatus Peregrinibacteria bacterium RIFOXYA12_FULL_33_12]OGJ51828.1 MAG: hypothetical protein A2307_05125 [Candidatus Peregrinibacteria bacterium RIFOXYB2_FULL_33_20]